MSSSFRFAVGFLLGCILSASAFVLAGAGHGTYVPVTANAPMLIIIPFAGVVAAFLGTPLLWAAYFLVIPKINSRILRRLAIGAVAAAHLGTATLMTSRDSYFDRVFENSPWSVVFHFAALILSVLILGVLAAVGSPQAQSNDG